MSEHDRERDERIGAAIRAAAESVQAPPGLRAAVAEQGERQARTRRRSWRLVAVGVAAAALALATVLSLGGGPSVQEVAQAALQAPTQPAPEGDGRFVDAQVGGVRFPDYEQRFGWSAIGAREDRVDGRDALTVIYRRGELGVHYTIVDGDPLPMPDGARRVRVGDVPVALVRDDGALVATWERDGRTCVLSTRSASSERLLELVAWS